MRLKTQIIAIALTFSFAALGQGGVSVIVNKSNSVSGLTEASIKNYFLRKVKSKWPDKSIIKPADIKGNSSSKVAFYQKVLKMSNEEVNRYNIQQQYARATKPPQGFSSDADVANFVSNNAGAIGYVKEGTSLPPGVKILLTVK